MPKYPVEPGAVRRRITELLYGVRIQYFLYGRLLRREAPARKDTAWRRSMPSEVFMILSLGQLSGLLKPLLSKSFANSPLAPRLERLRLRRVRKPKHAQYLRPLHFT